MILVLGATGNVGSRVVALARRAGHAVRAVSRNRADLSRPDTVAACLDGVDAVFLIWPLHSGKGFPAVLDTIAARVRRVVFLGTGGVPDLSFTEQEKLVHGCGIESTLLEPSTFAVNTLWWADQIRAGDVVRGAYGALPMNLIHEADLAEVAVCALTEAGHDKATYTLTGPEVWTQAEQVRVLCEALDRPLRWQELTRDEFRHQLLADPAFPDSFVDVLLDGYAAMLAGPPPRITATVADLTGHPARSLRQWATDHAADFR